MQSSLIIVLSLKTTKLVDEVKDEEIKSIIKNLYIYMHILYAYFKCYYLHLHLYWSK